MSLCQDLFSSKKQPPEFFKEVDLANVVLAPDT